MSSVKNQRAVENRMREALEQDRARVQVSRISRFGLLEMSRQRLRPSLVEVTTQVCPRCSGQGRIRDIRSLALAILRVMEEESLKERSSMVRALVPLNIASYLLNEKRQDVAAIERRTQTHIVIVPNVNMETPQYEVQRIRDDRAVSEIDVPSYELTEITNQASEDAPRESPAQPARERPVVQPPQPATPAPSPKPQPTGRGSDKPGFLKKIVPNLFSESSAETARQPAATKARHRGTGRRAAATEGRGRSRNRPERKRSADSNRASSQAHSAKEAPRKGTDRRGGKAPTEEPRKKGAAAKPAAKSGRPAKRRAQQQNREPVGQDADAGPAAAGNRKPSDAELAQSKRRPRRDRGRIAAQADGPRRTPEGTGNSAPATTTPAPAAATKPAPVPPANGNAGKAEPNEATGTERSATQAADERSDHAADRATEIPAKDAAVAPPPDPDTVRAGAPGEAPSQGDAPPPDAPPPGDARAKPRRAANDPREVRRRQREAALQAAESGKS